VRAVEVAKHIGKGSEKHTARSFEVAENPASFRELSNALAVAIFPFEYLRTQPLFVKLGFDVGNLEENLSEFYGIGPFRFLATPHQTLTLNVNETALDSNGWPEFFKGANHLRIAVNSATERIKAFLF